MEASVRLFNSSNSILLKIHPLIKSSPKFSHHSPFLLPPPRSPHISPYTIKTKPYAYNRVHSSFPQSSLSNTLGFLQFISSFNPLISNDKFARIISPSENKLFQWNFAQDGVNGESRGILGNNKEPIVNVVLLGWLGSKQKHLRRYVELYNLRGIHAITFVAPVKDLLSVDFGRRFQQRISCLADELVSWLSEREKDGRERFLLFHTFSNTGWLA